MTDKFYSNKVSVIATPHEAILEFWLVDYLGDGNPDTPEAEKTLSKVCRVFLPHEVVIDLGERLRPEEDEKEKGKEPECPSLS